VNGRDADTPLAGREEKTRSPLRCTSAADRERLLATVAAGAPVSSLGIPSSTIRSWRRRDPAFARAYADAQVAAGARTPSAPLELGEWERLLAQACRCGSVAALRLWRETHPGEQAGRVDELAALRELHARLDAAR
jgi:hypothetical protein